MKRQFLSVIAICFVLLFQISFAQGQAPNRQVGMGVTLGEIYTALGISYALSSQFHIGSWLGLQIGSVEGNSDVQVAFSPYGKYIFAQMARAAYIYTIGQFLISSQSFNTDFGSTSRTDAGLLFGLGAQAFVTNSISIFSQISPLQIFFGDVTAFYFGVAGIQLGFEIFFAR